MATPADANAIASHLDGTLRELFNGMVRTSSGLVSLQGELDRFTYGNVPGNSETARLVALAFVRRQRLATTGALRDKADDYLIAMARGRIPPPKPPNALSTSVHVDADPYRDWTAFVRREERLEGPMRRGLRSTWRTVASDLATWGVFAKAIIDARSLRPGDFFDNIGRRIATELGRTLVGLLANSHSSAMLGAVSRPSGVFLDTATQRSQDWAANYAGRLIVDINATQEATYRALVAQAFEDGVGPEELAWRLRESGLGLHTRWHQAVDRYYRGMVEEGVPRGTARERATMYAAHLRDLRADTIARTETVYAMNMGRMQLWNAAMQLDDLPTDVGKRWVTALDERVCPICKPMNNVIVGMNDFFDLDARTVPKGQEQKLFVPPAHPRCRCIVVLYHPNEKLLPARVA